MSYTAAQAQRINALVDAADEGEMGGDDAWIDQLLDPTRTPKRAPLRRVSVPSPAAGGSDVGSWDAAVAKMEGLIEKHGFWAIWALATFPVRGRSI